MGTNVEPLAEDNHRYYVRDSRHYGRVLRANTSEPRRRPAESSRFSHELSGVPVHANASVAAEAPIVVRPSSALADRAGVNERLRKTTRQDPLASQGGKILEEDLTDLQ